MDKNCIKMKDANKLSKKWMQKTLMNLGFTEKDSQVYLFLANKGPRNAKDIAKTLSMHNAQLHSILKKLQNNGLVIASSSHSTLFSAVIFEKALELLVEARREQHEALLASKEELLSTWRSITEKDEEKN
jgi:sugar-specific transcriptional regulator TrmB